MITRCLNLALFATTVLGTALGHMQMLSPAPIRSKFNKYSGSDIDYSMTSPLSPDGSNFPCKGYHNFLYDTVGTPITTLRGGETYSMTITGGAIHAGGSCQISLSIDGGQTFRVLHTYIGKCPSSEGTSSYQFKVPADVPSRVRALLAWTWFNKLGNREMYMNCASVTTMGNGDGSDFNSRPKVFRANIGNGCETVESTDVMIPNPGPFSTVENPNAVPPVGDCDDDSNDSGEPKSPTDPDYPTSSDKPPSYGYPTSNPGGDDGDDPGDRPLKDWTPGNDWPEGFPGGAKTHVVEVINLTFLSVLALVVVLLFCV